MTYGFTYEAAQDRLHETGEEERAPRTFPCPVCQRDFDRQHEVSLHLGADHPLSTPRLLVDGQVVVRQRNFQRMIQTAEVEAANATSMEISEDGEPYWLGDVEELREILARGGDRIVDVIVRNERAEDQAHAEDRVRLTLRVPDPSDLDLVDEVFSGLLSWNPDLTEQSLERFSAETSEASSADLYRSAVHQYGVAILIKDRIPGTGTSLPFSDHLAKFQSAQETLSEFPERPLARALCGVIRFSLNDFSAGSGLSGVPDLDRCNSAIQNAARVETFTVPDVETIQGRIPVDDATGLILDEFQKGRADKLLEFADVGTTTPNDVLKCRILAVKLDPVSLESTQIAGTLVNHPAFGAWASEILKDG